MSNTAIAQVEFDYFILHARNLFPNLTNKNLADGRQQLLQETQAIAENFAS